MMALNYTLCTIFQGADCDTNHYLVIARVRERLSRKQAAQKFDVEKFSLKTLSELGVMKQFHIKISNSFAALENLPESEDINRAWEKIKENVKMSAKESLGLYDRKQHKPWYDEECSQSLDKRKQVKMQWLWYSNQSNVDNLNNLEHKLVDISGK